MVIFVAVSGGVVFSECEQSQEPFEGICPRGLEDLTEHVENSRCHTNVQQDKTTKRRRFLSNHVTELSVSTFNYLCQSCTNKSNTKWAFVSDLISPSLLVQ